MSTIAAAFVAAKRSFGPALKDKNNPHFKSKYADLGACIDAVEDALLAQGVAWYQETSEDAAGVTIETVLLHESGESLRFGKLHVPAVKSDPQGFGSALTYARRYSLMTACGIAPEDDDGNAAAKARESRRAAWLADRKAAIMGALNAGEMKRLLAGAIEIAEQERDQDAIAELKATAAAKAATATARGVAV